MTAAASGALAVGALIKARQVISAGTLCDRVTNGMKAAVLGLAAAGSLVSIVSLAHTRAIVDKNALIASNS